MHTKRIIPCLDVKDGRVVKGTNFIGLRDAGDPVELSAVYDRERADELVLLDITASNEQRGTMVQVVSSCASQVFIPFTVGGGIRTVEDMRGMLKAGADKISLNTAAIKNPDIIRQGAEKFGRQCMVLAVDARRSGENSWEVYINGGRTKTGLDVLDWIKRGVALGAGEILLTSMDADGTKDGYDIPLNKIICETVNIPVIASGGCGKLNHFSDVFLETKVDAALAASLFHYKELTIQEVNSYLKEKNIPVRTSL